jgi:hypothetical protein
MLSVDQDDYGQADCCLCCCHGDYENGEHLSGHSLRVYELREGDEIYINRIEQKLDRHQNSDGIPAGQNPEYPDAEKQGAQR